MMSCTFGQKLHEAIDAPEAIENMTNPKEFEKRLPDEDVAGSGVSERDLGNCHGSNSSIVKRRARMNEHGSKCPISEGEPAFCSTQTHRSRIYTSATCQRRMCTTSTPKKMHPR